LLFTYLRSLFTAFVNCCHLLQQEITTPSPLTGSGEAGFGKKTELLAKPELKVSFEVMTT